MEYTILVTCSLIIFVTVLMCIVYGLIKFLIKCWQSHFLRRYRDLIYQRNRWRDLTNYREQDIAYYQDILRKLYARTERYEATIALQKDVINSLKPMETFSKVNETVNTDFTDFEKCLVALTVDKVPVIATESSDEKKAE